MEKLRYVTDAEQIAAIDNAVAGGWLVRRVDTDAHGIATITFTRIVGPGETQSALVPALVFPGLETQTIEWGCGLVAGGHAEDLMKAAIA